MPGTAAQPSLPSIDEIKAAAELVYKFMAPTPQNRWPLLCQRLGTEVWVKQENQTPIGAFKARTAIVYVDRLVEREPGTTGLISATRGNHGQSVAIAAQRAGLPSIVVVPIGNSIEKNAAMRAQGAQLIEHGADYQEAREEAARLGAQNGYHFIPPYHRDIVLGVATYWLELFTARPDLDVAYVPIGMGSGAVSAAAVRNGLGLKTKLVGVVSSEAPSYALSFEAKRCVEAPVRTKIADGLACRKPDREALQILVENLDHVVLVTDEEVSAAMRHYFSDTHTVVEGAGAASLAGALQEAGKLRRQRVAVIATGANVDRDLYAEVLSGRA